MFENFLKKMLSIFFLRGAWPPCTSHIYICLCIHKVFILIYKNIFIRLYITPAYSCQGRWQSGALTYVVATPNAPRGSPNAPRRLCFAHASGGSATAARWLTLTARTDTCAPPNPSAYLTYNATLTGEFCRQFFFRLKKNERIFFSVSFSF